VDLSSSGIQLELLDPPKNVRQYLKKIGHKVFLKVDVPGGKYLERIVGTVRWYRTLQTSHPERDLVGIQFQDIGLDGKIELLTYALKKAFMRQMRLVGLGIAAVFMLAGSIAALAAYQQIGYFEKTLIHSQNTRMKLEREIDALAAERNRMKKQLTANEMKLQQRLSEMRALILQREAELSNTEKRLQEVMEQAGKKEMELADREALIQREKREIAQKEEELKKLREQRALAEEQGLEEFTFPDIGGQDIITYEKEIAQDPLSKAALREMSKKRYRNAEQYYRRLAEKYPDSLAATRLLFQVLKKQGKQEEADKVYVDFSIRLLGKK
jgi:TolA-binding protein